jgi:hypothetical protein
LNSCKCHHASALWGNQTNLQTTLENSQSTLKKQITLKLKTIYLHENSDHLEKEHIAPLEEGFEISFASYADFYLQQCPPCSAED